MTQRASERGFAAVSFLVLVALMAGFAIEAQGADVFRVGDILVGQNNGSYQFIRVTGSGSRATFNVLDSLSDGSANNTAGCTFSPMFRPITVSYTSGVAPSNLQRYQLSDVGTPHSVIVQSDTSGGGGLSGKSVAMDAQSSVYIGHSGGDGEIDQYIQPG